MTKIEKIHLRIMKDTAEREVQKLINKTVKNLGYDDENSIAKYLVEGNVYYKECSRLSLWIGLVWETANASTAMTLEELFDELPKWE